MYTSPALAQNSFVTTLTTCDPNVVRDTLKELDYAIRQNLFRPEDEQLIELVRQKIRIPGNEPVNTSEPRLTELRQQVEAQLRPVLRESDFQSFDLDRAFGVISDMAARVA